MDAEAARTASRQLGRSRAANENGQGLAEYLIIVVVVAIVVIVAVRYFGGSVGGQFKDANQKLEKVGSSDTDRKATETNASDRTSSGSGTGGSSSRRGVGTETDGSSATADGSEVKGSVETSTIDGEAPSAEVEDIGATADALSRGVGDSDVKPIEQIKISWGTLALLAALFCGIGVYLVARFSKNVKQQNGQKKKKKGLFASASDGGESGQAMVEFVLSAISFLFCILGVIQLVRYAAYNAARAGIVHSADLAQMREAARISLLAVFPRHGRADHVRGFTENYLGAVATDQNPINTQFLEPITEVRIIDNNSLPSGRVITFDDPVEGQDAILTVQVVHRYELVIPLVNRILYYIYTRIRTLQGYQQETINRLSAETDELRRTGSFRDIEYRLPLVAHYTMRLQSDYVVPSRKQPRSRPTCPSVPRQAFGRTG